MKLEIQVGMNNDYSYSYTRLNDYAAFVIVKDENGMIKSAEKTDGMKKASFVKVVKLLASQFGFEVEVDALYKEAKEKVQQRIVEAKS